MNHPIDPNPEAHPRADPELCRRADPPPATHLREVCSRSADPSHDSKHLKLLDALVDKIIQNMNDNSCQPKIRVALKAIQLRDKVAKTSDAERIFWSLIDDIKREEFSEHCPVPPSLTSQIKETILGLRDLVKNGILPLKTVTDAFNQSRFEQARLTYRRMSRLLSVMGFAKAKTPTGSSAVIWDDKLLPQDTSSAEQNSCSEDVCGSAGVQTPYRPVGDARPGDSAAGGGEGKGSSSPLEERTARGPGCLTSLQGESRPVLDSALRLPPQAGYRRKAAQADACPSGQTRGELLEEREELPDSPLTAMEKKNKNQRQNAQKAQNPQYAIRNLLISTILGSRRIRRKKPKRTLERPEPSASPLG
jgi:hypothetical protein